MKQSVIRGGANGPTSSSANGSSAPPATHAPFQASDEDLKATMYMGVNVKTTVKRNSKHQQGAAAPQLQRKVVNCLRCGKVFDCRRPDSDAMQFLAAGGRCTYCGGLVRLDYDNGTSNMMGDANDLPATPPTNDDSTDQTATSTQAEAEAVALRDRLVQFDRQGAKRTSVIDDQSDYFAIDSNAWLSDAERAELKRQQREAEEAAEERRRRITVTVDLLGRKIVMDDGEQAVLADADAKAAAVAMEATAAVRPQGGGTAVAAAALQEGSERRVGVSPSMAAAGYVFVPQRGEKKPGGGGAGNGAKQGSKKKQRGGEKKGSMEAAKSAAHRPPRVQHDGE